VVSSLDVLGEIHQISDSDKKDYINWIYAQQVHPNHAQPNPYAGCGFRGGPCLGLPFSLSPETLPPHLYDEANIAMTYVALALLRILGDDFSRVNKKAIREGLKSLQLPDGSFVPVQAGGESDIRFIFCACAISSMLQNFSGLDIPRLTDYIVSSQGYDGGIAQGPLQESHGGSTYCAVAALYLTGGLSSLRVDDLVAWCLKRQQSGFNGRINKRVDTCYSFWIGAAIHLLGYHTLINYPAMIGYSITCQSGIGGFGKWADTFPDVLHSYFGLCGISLCGEEGLLPLDAGLGITARASGEWLAGRQPHQFDIKQL